MPHCSAGLTETPFERMFDTRLARLCHRGEAAGSAGRGAPNAARLPPAALLRWGDSMPAFLARHYDAPTEVERRDEAPAAFVWRGRRHVVRAVLGHWWQTGALWGGLAGWGDDDVA